MGAEERLTIAEGWVRVNGPVHTKGQRLDGAERRVPYSAALLRDLADALGPHLIDELDRELDPGYLRHRFERILRDIGGHTVLDFGCGRGSSTLVLARLGVGRLTGVDIDERAIGLARRRAAEQGLRADFATQVPAGPFDLVFCNAVLEHLTPDERGPAVRRLWAAVRPGGHLVVMETPNRLFPIDRHTTGLPLVPWLPVTLKLRLGDFRSGIHGVSMRDFDAWIPRRERRERPVSAFTATERPRGAAERAAIGLLKGVTHAIAGLADLPPAHFYAYLLACFQKTTSGASRPAP